MLVFAFSQPNLTLPAPHQGTRQTGRHGPRRLNRVTKTGQCDGLDFIQEDVGGAPVLTIVLTGPVCVDRVWSKNQLHDKHSRRDTVNHWLDTGVGGIPGLSALPLV